MERLRIWLERAAEICSDPGYATIIAAVIGGVVMIIVAVYNKRKKKTDRTKVVVVPAPADPLSMLKADAAGVEEIDDLEFGSQEYAETLAARMEMLKNQDSELDVCYGRSGEDD